MLADETSLLRARGDQGLGLYTGHQWWYVQKKVCENSVSDSPACPSRSPYSRTKYEYILDFGLGFHPVLGLKEYVNADFSAVAATWVGALSDTMNKGEYLKALAMDPVSLGHNIVHIIRASSQHRKGFHDTIINGNANEWYTGNATKLPVIELLRDIKTRWDSIFFMINQLHAVRLVSSH